MIQIEGYHFWSDWTTMEPYTIDEDKIFGFELHYRGSESWHIKVCTKEKCLHGYYSYEIGHGVTFMGAVGLLQNPKAKLLKIINYHKSDDFIEQLKKLFEKTSQDETKKRIP